jgi:hypothetical protein
MPPGRKPIGDTAMSNAERQRRYRERRDDRAGVTTRKTELTDLRAEVGRMQTEIAKLKTKQAVVTPAQAGAAAGAAIDTSALKMSDRERFARLEAKLRGQFAKQLAVERDAMIRQNDAEVQRRIDQHINGVLLPRYRDRLEKADKILHHKKPFTAEQYRKLLGALHPDRFLTILPDDKLREQNELFILFKDAEVLLRQAKPMDSLSAGFPRTREEMVAGRAVKAAKERAKRQERRRKKEMAD